MHAWAQLTSLALSAVGFILAAWPRTGVQAAEAVPATAKWPAMRLVRFPVFWGGLIILAYIAAQGLNPAWRFESNADSWWLAPLPHVSWVPAGVEAPYARSNPWRALTIYGSLWLLVCSVWAGFFRRQSYRALFTIIVGNAFLLAVLGVLEELIVTKKIFWFYRPSSTSFISSFIYRNHAGCYFNLMVALAAGLAWWHYKRTRRGFESPTSAVVLAFAAVMIGVMVIFSYSRMSIALLAAFAAIVAFTLTLGLFRRHDPLRDRRDFLPALIAVASFLCVCFVTLRSQEVWKRFAEMVTDPAATAHTRTLARKAARDMLRDRPFFGWGAGCFRYGFPIFAQNYPDIYYSPPKGRMYWEHAHDDLLEFPIEFGLVGLSPMVVVFGYLAWQLARQRFWRNAVSFCIVSGCAFCVVHAYVDFVLQNPAVILTWGTLLVGALRWAELDQPDARRTQNLPVTPDPGRVADRIRVT